MTRWLTAAKLVLASSAALVAALGLGPAAPVGSRIIHALRARLAVGQGVADQTPVDSASAAPRSAIAAAIGVNVPQIRSYDTTVPFANLAIGGGFLLGWSPVAADAQDGDGRLFAAGSGSSAAPTTVHRALMIPTSVPDNYRVNCTWSGGGSVTVGGGPTTASSGRGRMAFVIPKVSATSRTGIYLNINDVDRAHPLADLDCRGNDTPPGTRFRPGFVQALRGYKVLRFMDWQNTNANAPVTWATRHTPHSIRVDQDGVSIEDMMDLANVEGADPWFCVPWNADDDYVARFAAAVRDRLPAGHHVYVETSNEVWNTGFDVAKQAKREGLAEGLTADPSLAGLLRYAEKTTHVMTIWEKAFAGRAGLVRVASSQHAVPFRGDVILGFKDTRNHVDALATAPYFGFILGGNGIEYQSVLTRLSGALDATIALGNENRAIAQKYGKRYISYEGGQGLELYSNTDVLRKIETSQDMYLLYKKYLQWWQRDNGDLLMLYHAVGPIRSGTAWGQAEYETDTPANTPKLRAIVEARDH